MDMRFRPTRAEINLDNLQHNISEIKRITSSGAFLCAVVKADAYGHGAVEVANTALSCGAKYLAVAILEEAVFLREAGIKAPILILGFTPEEQFDKIVKYGITQTVYNLNSAKLLSKKAKECGVKAKVHIKLDTGMSRIGFQAQMSCLPEIEEIFKLPGIEVEGIFTHFAKADEKDKSFTKEQYEKFDMIVKALESRGFRIPIKHVANSAAIIDLPEMHLDMVRPGIILYGIYPSDEVKREKINLKPVMSFKTRVSHVKRVPAGTPISYGGTFVTKRESVIATLPVGYADGYPRLLSSRAEVLIKGKRAPIVGRICMDQCMVDVTDVPGVRPGDDVELFGEGKNGEVTADEIARIVGTIPYEIVCGISKRVPRIYIKNGKIIKINNPLA